MRIKVGRPSIINEIIDNYEIGSYFGKLGAVEIGFVGLEIDGGDEVIGVPGAPTTFEVGFVGIFEEVLVTAQSCVLRRFFPTRNILIDLKSIAVFP